ncbi:hypothetical protein Pmani_004058 [Petrolisthes manimaculis]|uniref:C2H2-type domain-containing protein n=1 Tax=Petrolisthes manimaculis TaxID=1843537 RepID=A0AAE1ULW3_9EUCA|nr:hypothetical protein Pmani_004058 [Petrolisthes manimaculis]
MSGSSLPGSAGAAVAPTSLLPPVSGLHSCQYCPRTFYLRSDLTRHVRIHTGEKPFNCPYCNHATARKSSLKKHLLSKHTPAITTNF